MINRLAGFIVFVTAAAASANEVVYEGTWTVTNRQLKGTMTCVVTDLGSNRWHGRFYGVWEGVPYSYEADFTGPPNELRGTAFIDGARYAWTGEIRRQTPGFFRASFGGDRYIGNFNLKEKGK